MSGYYRLIPEFIASHPSLSSEEKLFYGLITALVSKYGFCWASNKSLAEKMNLHPRTIPKFLKRLTKLKFLIVEVEYQNERKIWTPETWAQRDHLLKAYGQEIIESRENFNQRFYTHAPKGTPPMPLVAPPPIYNVENSTKTCIKHIEARPAKSPPKDKWKKPCKTPAPEEARPSGDMKKNEEKAPAPEVKVLKPSMKGPTPTPGSDKMVEEVIDILRSPHRLGTQRVILAKGDWEYLFGFSPSIIEKAFARAHKASQKGEKIYNLTAWLYTMCSQIKLE